MKTMDEKFNTLFIHHVYFWLKKPVTDDAKTQFESALKKLVKVGTIVDYHLGVPAGTDRNVIDSSYSYSLLLTFKNRSDQDIYQTHPLHLEFVEKNSNLWERVIVYDSVSM